MFLRIFCNTPLLNTSLHAPAFTNANQQPQISTWLNERIYIYMIFWLFSQYVTCSQSHFREYQNDRYWNIIEEAFDIRVRKCIQR